MPIWRRNPAREQDPLPAPANSGAFGPLDFGIAAGLLAATLAVCLPLAASYRQEASSLDRERVSLAERCGQLQTTLDYLEQKRAADAEERRAVTRYVAEVEARSLVPWTTVVSELSLRRPKGVWTGRISGDGPQFRAEVSATNPALVSAYAQGLRNSPYVEFAGLPSGESAGAQGEIVGKVRGN